MTRGVEPLSALRGSGKARTSPALDNRGRLPAALGDDPRGPRCPRHFPRPGQDPRRRRLAADAALRARRLSTAADDIALSGITRPPTRCRVTRRSSARPVRSIIFVYYPCALRSALTFPVRPPCAWKVTRSVGPAARLSGEASARGLSTRRSRGVCASRSSALAGTKQACCRPRGTTILSHDRVLPVPQPLCY